MRQNRPGGGLHLRVRRGRTSVTDIVANRAREDERILQHNADLGTQAFDRYVAHVDSVQKNFAFHRIVEAA
ncbi:hypothetical protein D3C84_1275560 [compost metagenome]